MLPHGGAFASLEESRLEVAYYLDTYFNLDRRTPPWATAHRTNLNTIFKSAYLSALSVFTGPPHSADYTQAAPEYFQRRLLYVGLVKTWQ